MAKQMATYKRGGSIKGDVVNATNSISWRVPELRITNKILNKQ